MKFFLPLFSLLFLHACQAGHTVQVSPAFYHWKTELHLSPEENQYLRSLHATRLYTKFFDVDWDANAEEAVPLATLEVSDTLLSGLEIVPTIFITNRTMSKIAPADLPLLCNRMYQKIKSLGRQIEGFQPRELQLDCDWSQSTRENYFRLVSDLRDLAAADSLIVSVTIRLHQYRYPELTGVPPADRGMLMFYNMGDLEDWNEYNSILNLEKATLYLTGHPTYTLPLDLALPIFSWGVLYREGRMSRLINGLREGDLADTGRFLKIGPQRYEIIKSTYLDGFYLYRGDRLRLESPTIAQLEQAVRLLKPVLGSGQMHLAFYHLDTNTIKHFPHEALEAIGNQLASP